MTERIAAHSGTTAFPMQFHSGQSLWMPGAEFCIILLSTTANDFEDRTTYERHSLDKAKNN